MVVQNLEAPELQHRLPVSLILWWNRLAGSSPKPKRILMFVPSSWGQRIDQILALVRIPLRLFRYDLESGEVFEARSWKAKISWLDSPYEIHWRSTFYPDIFAELKEQIPQIDLLFRKRRWELSFLGYPLAWAEIDGTVWFDINRPVELNSKHKKQFSNLVRQVESFRRFPPPDPSHPFYRYGEERWMESIILRNLRLVHSNLDSEIYSQVPTWVGDERRILDLLGVTKGGRLVVIELKAGKDLTLLFQGLDYWERVRYHLQNEDFRSAGYFNGRDLKNIDPMLYLVTPLFNLHRTYPILSRYLSREISCCLVGINQDWKKGIKFIRKIELGSKTESN
jgi:hypothetical protein